LHFRLFIIIRQTYTLIFMEGQHGPSAPPTSDDHFALRRNTMNASKFIVATAALVGAVSATAFAADAPASTTAASAIAATKLNVPSLAAGAARERAEVKAEAVEAAKHHSTALADQLDQYKH
jgi:hypothetical protein